MGDDWLEAFDHKWSATIATPFVPMQEVWDASSGIMAILVNTMAPIHIPIKRPEMAKCRLPLRNLRQVMACQYHPGRLIQQGLHPGLHPQEGPVHLFGSILRLPECDPYQPTRNFNRVQDVVLVDQLVQVSTSVGR